MYELKKIGKVFTSKFVGTGPSSIKKEFTGPRSHKGWEILLYLILDLSFRDRSSFSKTLGLLKVFKEHTNDCYLHPNRSTGKHYRQFP